MKPVLLVALDFVDLQRALKCAGEVVEGGADWLEIGTPLLKSEGLNAVRAIRERFPDKLIVVDTKIVDAGRIEVECVGKAGGKIATVLSTAPDSTIRESVEAGKNYGVQILVDLLGEKSVFERVKRLVELGVDYVCMHSAIDEQMEGKDMFEELKQVTHVFDVPVGIAGGLNSESVVDALNAGASVIVVGGAITKSVDAKKATADIKKAISSLTKIPTEFFKRVKTEHLKSILEKVSTANISDALHRKGALKGINAVTQNAKMVGEAVTVRTYPGDWAKPVEAIDRAKKGEVIVIDAGGIPPAVWGELATHSCLQKGVAGVVVFGAVRDAVEIRKLNFPAFSKSVCPNAGEPRGFGEIGVTIEIQGITIEPGDWIVGDDDGVVVIPKIKAVEYTNRAMDVLEKENRIRKEIQEGETLSSVTELLKWEKK